MTRDELIETMARAIAPAVWAESMPVPTRAYVFGFHSSRQESAAIARAALAAIEAEGLAIVPVEATNAMADTGTEARWKSAVRDADNTREIYRAMIEAGRI